MERDSPVLCSRATARLIFIAGVALCCGFGVWVATRPLSALLGCVPDDAFYYLKIARNIASGLGSTLDGETTTNGYHPGWMMVLVGMAHLIHDRETLLRASLAIAFALNIPTALAIAAIFREWFDDSWAWLVGALWLLNPLPYILAVQAVEANLYGFAIALTVLVLVRWVLPRAKEGVWSWSFVGFGLALGFTFCARTEGALLAVTAIPLLFLTARRPRLGIGICAVVLAATLVVCLPFAVYSLREFGTIAQDSGAIKVFWRASNAPSALEPGVGMMYQFVFGYAAPCGFGIIPWLAMLALGLSRLRPGRAGSNQITTWHLLILACVGIAAALVYRTVCGNCNPERAMHLVVMPLALFVGLIAVAGKGRAWWLVAAWLAFVTLLQILVYGMYFSDYQLWYMVIPGVALYIVAMAEVVGLASRAMSARGVRYGILIAAAVLLAPPLIRFPRFVLNGKYPWQRDVYTSQLKIDRTLDPRLRIGCLNAGIPAYFSDRFITNLDGVVNHQIRPYYESKRLDDYLRRNRITIICDEKWSMGRAECFTSRPLRKRALATYPLTKWWDGRRYVWEIEF